MIGSGVLWALAPVGAAATAVQQQPQHKRTLAESKDEEENEYGQIICFTSVSAH